MVKKSREVDAVYVTAEQIRAIAVGATEIDERDGTVLLCRFTKEQRALYRDTSADFYMKSFSTAGVRLEFDTDSKQLELAVAVSPGSSRLTTAVHSVFVDGERIGELPVSLELDQKDMPHSGSFALGEGTKRVKIVFPWSMSSRIVSLSLDDGATVTPVAKSRRMIIFGDSITQGYDASKPEKSYASILADGLDANAVNKGIGGEKFFPALATLADDFDPEIITVAYGTNDWSKREKAELDEMCTAFYHNLAKTYPKARIVAISPLWRPDIDAKGKDYPLTHVAAYLNEVAADIPQMTVIDAMDFIPHDVAYFTDNVHPNDRGFDAYAEHLLKALIAQL